MAKPRKRQSHRDAVQAVSQAAYARQRGFSREAVRKAVAAGRIPVLKRGRINPKTADRALRDRTDPTKLRGRHAARANGHSDPRRSGSGKMPKLYESKARREHALAQLAELELAELNGQMVRKKDVEESGFTAARQTRDEILSIPDRWSPSLVGKTYLEVHAILTAESRRLCEAVKREVLEEPPVPEPAGSAPATRSPAPPAEASPSPPNPTP